MIIEGKFTLKTPIARLWEMLLEPDTLGSCMPSAQMVERIDEKTYEAVMQPRLGPIRVTLRFKNILTKVEPPTHIELEGEGQDMTKLGHIRQRTVVDLKELDSGEVELSYKADLNLVGKLAMFGDRIMKSKAKNLEKKFAANLQNRLKTMEL